MKNILRKRGEAGEPEPGEGIGLVMSTLANVGFFAASSKHREELLHWTENQWDELLLLEYWRTVFCPRVCHDSPRFLFALLACKEAGENKVGIRHGIQFDFHISTSYKYFPFVGGRPRRNGNCRHSITLAISKCNSKALALLFFLDTETFGLAFLLTSNSC